MSESESENKGIKLIFNNVVIGEDGFMNATQMCKLGNKEFNAWYRLGSTDRLIEELTKILKQDGVIVVDVKKGRYGGSWIHPDLAIQLGRWISPIFALQNSRVIVSKPIKTKEELQNELILKQTTEIETTISNFRRNVDISSFDKKNVVYIAFIGGKLFKYGHSSKFDRRLSTHLSKFVIFEIVCVVECQNSKLIESGFSNFLSQKQLKTKFVDKTDHNNIEIFMLKKFALDTILIELTNLVSRQITDDVNLDKIENRFEISELTHVSFT